MEAKVLVIGDVLMDYQYWVEKMPSTGNEEKIKEASQSIGGSALNTALALKAQGIASSFAGYVGRDEIGEYIVAKLKAAGLDLSALQRGEKTGYCLTMIDKTGERTMFADRAASKRPLQFTPPLCRLLSTADLLFLTGYYLVKEKQAEFSLQAAKKMKASGGLVALDPSPDIGLVAEATLTKMLSLTDIILPNERELEVLTAATPRQAGIHRLLEQVPCIALKLGAQGSFLALRKGFRLANGRPLSQNETQYQGVQKTKPVDTTGAGDAFNGGFLASFLKSEGPSEWLQKGNKLANKVIQCKGASSFFLEAYPSF